MKLHPLTARVSIALTVEMLDDRERRLALVLPPVVYLWATVSDSTITKARRVLGAVAGAWAWLTDWQDWAAALWWSGVAVAAWCGRYDIN